MKKLLVGLLVAVSFGSISFAARPAAAVIDSTRDCDTVAIIRCGALSGTELRTKYDENQNGDVQKVFATFGIEKADLTGFSNGVVYQNGDVFVGDKKVATGAVTAGRMQPSGATRIAGTDAWQYSTSHFVTEGQTALVKMNGDTFEFAVVKPCGNPVKATPVPQPPTPTPAYECKSLTATAIDRTQYSFKVVPEVSGGAKVTKYTFDYGDGSSFEVTRPVQKHAFAREGTYTVKVTAYVTVNGETKTTTSPDCSVPVTVAPLPITPIYRCDQLTARTISQVDRKYGYDLRYTAEGGATLQSVDFTFGDGQGRTGVIPAQLSSVEHVYAKEGTYTTTATLHFNASGSVKDVACQIGVTINPEACPLNPSLAKSSPDCAPCPYNSKLPKNSPECKAPPVELPRTGPAEVLTAGLGMSSITAASYYWRKSKKSLLESLLKR